MAPETIQLTPRSRLCMPDCTFKEPQFIVLQRTKAAAKILLSLPEPVDHGTEFTSKALDQWAWDHGVKLDFTRPGKPTDNGLCESFNGRLRDECLNVNEFVSIEQAREKIEAWRIDYNEQRPPPRARPSDPE